MLARLKKIWNYIIYIVSLGRFGVEQETPEFEEDFEHQEMLREFVDSMSTERTFDEDDKGDTAQVNMNEVVVHSSPEIKIKLNFESINVQSSDTSDETCPAKKTHTSAELKNGKISNSDSETKFANQEDLKKEVVNEDEIARIEKECRDLDQELIKMADERIELARQADNFLNSDDLSVLRDDAPLPVVVGDEEFKASISKDLIPVPDGLFTPLMLACNSSDTQLSNYSVRALAERTDRESDERLLALATGRNAPVVYRSKAIESIGRRRMEKAKDILVDALEDVAADVRYSAVWALGELGIDPVPLIKRLEDENHFVRSAALHALGRLGAVEAGPSIIKCLGDKSEIVSRSAEETLAAFGESVINTTIATATNDADESVRAAALKVLKRIAGEDQLTNVLLAATKDKSIHVRQVAVDGLIGLNNPELLDPLVDALKSIDDALLAEAMEFDVSTDVNALQEKIGEQTISKAEDTGFISIQSLAGLDRRLAVGPVKKALASDSLYIRGSACYTIARLHMKEALLDLISTAETDREGYVRHAAVTALGQMEFDKKFAKRMTRLLKRALKDSTEEMVYQAIVCAGEWKTPVIETELRRMARKGDERLRYAAENALRKKGQRAA